MKYTSVEFQMMVLNVNPLFPDIIKSLSVTYVLEMEKGMNA